MSEWWRDHGTLGLSVGTAVGYLVGYASVAAFATALSVTAQNLGLEFRDYLLLASVNTGVWCVLALAPLAALRLGIRVSTALEKSQYRTPGVLVFAVILLVAALLLVTVIGATYVSFGTFDGIGISITSVAYFVVLGIPVAAVALSIGEREGFRATVISMEDIEEDEAETDSEAPKLLGVEPSFVALLMVSTLIASSIMMVTGAIQWANRLEDWAHSGDPLDARPSAPPALALLLRPELGEATATIGPNSVKSCAIRIGSDVYLGAASVAVVHDAPLFSVGTCRLPDTPFRR